MVLVSSRVAYSVQLHASKLRVFPDQLTARLARSDPLVAAERRLATTNRDDVVVVVDALALQLQAYNLSTYDCRRVL